MYCENCGEKLAEGTKFCAKCGHPVDAVEPVVATGQIEYYSIYPGRLFLFSILTFNLYEIYWFYRNWLAVKKAEGTNIQPFWRAIFTVFFCYEFFTKVLRTAKSNGYTDSYSAGWMATAYIVLLLAGNALGRANGIDPGSYLLGLIILLILTPLPLLPIQRAINFNNAKIVPHHSVTKTFTAWEVTLIIVGILLTALVVLGTIGSMSS